MTILETNELSKHYGSRVAVNKISLNINQGEIFGLLGPNGSGKTTTLGMILGVIRPNHGAFSWFREKPSANNRKRIGAILETPCFYPYLSAEDNLKIVAQIKGCGYDNIDMVLKEVDLLDRKTDKFQSYSLGMKQRLAIASALLVDPEVLILDEPTNGLDPEGIVEIRNLITNIASSGKTIILASHLLSEVQKVCSHFAVLKNGKLLHQGSIRDMAQEKIIIEVGASDMVSLKQVLDQIKGVKNIHQDANYFNLEVEQEVTAEYVMNHLQSNGIIPSHLTRKEGSLEQQFLKILSENA